MPPARGRRRRWTDDDWTSDSADNDLPDWIDTDECHLEDLKRAVLQQPCTRSDVMQFPAVLRRCHFRPLATLSKRLQRLILTKLQRLEDSLPYADEALDAPGRLHVLLWLPPAPASPASPTSTPPDTSSDPCIINLTQLLDATELRRTRLADPHRRSGAAAAAAAAAAEGTSQPDAHLLGFCLLARRRDPASGGRYTTIEYFNTLVGGYNFGQLLFERAGDMCRRSTAAATAAAAQEATVAVAAPPPLAFWPLPSAPKNIFYWIKLERIPALGRGGMLRAFAEMRLAATPSPPATAGAADASAARGLGRRLRGGHAAGGAQRQSGARSAPPSPPPPPATASARVEAGAGAGAGGDSGSSGILLAAFRHFCVERLKWEPVEVDAYMASIGGEEGAAALLAAAATTAGAASAPLPAAPGIQKEGEGEEEDGGRKGSLAEASRLFLSAGVESAAPEDPAAAAAAAPPPPPRQEQTSSPVVHPRQLELKPLRSQRDMRAAALTARNDKEPITAVRGAAAAAGGKGRTSERWGPCVPRSRCVRRALGGCCCAAASLQPPPGPGKPLMRTPVPSTHQIYGIARWSVGRWSAEGPRLLRTGGTHGSVVRRAAFAPMQSCFAGCAVIPGVQRGGGGGGAAAAAVGQLRWW